MPPKPKEPKPRRNPQDMCPKDDPNKELWNYLLAGPRATGAVNGHSKAWRKEQSEKLKAAYLEDNWFDR